MLSDYTKKVQETFLLHEDPTQGAAMSKYMRNKFEYFGINSPTRKDISKPLLSKQEIPAMNDIPDITREFWNLPQRELQYFTLDLLQKFIKKCPADWIDLFEELIITKSWWDTVDGVAPNLVGYLFQRFPTLLESYTNQWMDSENIWLQRSCLLFQLRYKHDTDFELLKSFIEPLAASDEFFIRKAIGWSLRQYAKFNQQAVIQYVAKQPLSKLSRTEALKHLQ